MGVRYGEVEQSLEMLEDNTMNNEFNYTKPISTQIVKNAYDNLNLSYPLPDFFLCWIEKNNAGLPKNKRILLKNKREVLCGYFLDFDTEEKRNVVTVYNALPPHLKKQIPFAEDPFGNFFVFDSSGSVNYLDLDLEVYTSCSDSFDCFLAELY